MRYSTYKSIHKHEQVLMAKPEFTYEKHNSMFSLRDQITRRAMIKFLITITVFIAGCSVVFKASAGDQPVLLNQQIVVSSGDTLWSISLANKPEQMDTRIYVEALKNTNQLTHGTIQTGQVLYLPQFRH
ncbi:LysM peptidoglycan-binding domain-containing protein [Paenibacillus sp. 2TAF8]|uniref:LysM peptidoglycan-binding domain-containing protein n=1 Tax=Paenibacillus sp. 2TAF8 TaxID=3233020 RepID=UPI003F97D561